MYLFPLLVYFVFFIWFASLTFLFGQDMFCFESKVFLVWTMGEKSKSSKNGQS